MISRTYVQCSTCKNPITARIQVGHEVEQPITFPCPDCGTDIRLTLILDEPPTVKIRWEENCEQGTQEGKIINLGAGFTISKDRLHQDMYFPAFSELPTPIFPPSAPSDGSGPEFHDIFVELGALPKAADYWKFIQKALRFHRTGRADLRDAQLSHFAEQGAKVDSLDRVAFRFFARMLAPRTGLILDPLVEELKQIRHQYPAEFSRLANDYAGNLLQDRFHTYSDVFSEYFRGYVEFNQTLVYVRNGLPLQADAVATSSAFETTKMFYGNAFEALGSHLDLPAAVNNIAAGRAYDQMKAMDIKKFRSLNKANRTNCFADNVAMSWFVVEYDSTIRNASHHRWFKLDDSRQNIQYRSGGTGAVHTMSYAEYLYRCNRLAVQLMAMVCWELLFLRFSGKSL